MLPSPMENFSAVVLEALSYATPVICTTGTPWQAVEERRCGWRVEPDSAAALASALAAATSISDAERAEFLHQKIGDHFRHTLLQLRTARDSFDDARDLAQPDDASLRDIADISAAKA